MCCTAGSKAIASTRWRSTRRASAAFPGLLDAVRAGGVQPRERARHRRARGSGAGGVWDDAGDWIADRHRRPGGPEPLRRISAERRPDSRRSRWTPCLVGQQVEYRPVVLRLQLVASDRKIDVMQGASARVLNVGDDPNVPTAATAKDVWVIGGTVAPPVVSRREPLPQVDLIASVPTRAAEALFWAGRALERAELVATVARGGARTDDRCDRHRHRRAVGRSRRAPCSWRSPDCRRAWHVRPPGRWPRRAR